MFVGLIGGGNISDTHARAARAAGLTVAACFGDNLDRTQGLADAHGARAYDSFDAFLRHRPMDLVIIGSPSGRHGEEGMAAARAGLHVLVEKPIEISTTRTDALIAAADEAGVRLGVCFQDRVKPGVQRLREIVAAGGLGAPVLIDARVKWYRPPEYYGASRWRGTWALDGGGAVINQGIHTIDLLLHVAGDVSRVFACTKTLLHAIEAEDTAVAVLEFASGAIGTFEASTSAFPGYQRRVEITGTEGTVVLEHDQIVAADLRTPRPDLLAVAVADTNPSANSAVVSDVGGHRRLIEDFVRAIQTGARPVCDGREGRRSVALVEAIYESSRAGAAVNL